jgi:hypothetical protein
MPDSSYGNWLYRRHTLNLPLDTPPPPGVESYETWFRRVRGIDPASGEPWGSPSERARMHPGASSPRETVPSSFLRQALSKAGSIATRLGAIGGGFRNAVPAFGAISTIIHAIREGQDLQKAIATEAPVLRADLAKPGKLAAKANPATPRMG